MRRKKVAVLGAGSRGCSFAGRICQSRLAEVVAVAEPLEEKRNQFCEEFKIKSDQAYPDWQSFVKEDSQCDAVVITTMDRDHAEPAVACLDKGYDVLLEKPMAVTLEDCRAIEATQRRTGGIVAVCHSMRYNRTTCKAKELIDSGAIGRLISLDLLEPVKPWHHVTSYVRGRWANSKTSSFMLLAKSCHDIDYLAYLTETPCNYVSSFGSLTWFRPENAPEGAPLHCIDGCPAEFECPYATWKCSPHADLRGRCVYHCDNDAVDHQVVILEFADDITATFTMTAFGKPGGRRLRAHGTEGELLMYGAENRIEVRKFPDRANKSEQNNGDTINFDLAMEVGGHGGGDQRITLNWLRALHSRDQSFILTDAQESLRTHTIVFAAEKARLEKRVVAVKDV